jgi:Tfp pilus assembly protein PilZ
LTVNYSTLGDAFKGLVKDISAGGMFILSIETAKVFSVGQELIVNFPTPAKKQKPIEFPGKVVWTVPKGIGVKFKAKDQNLEAIIESL